MLLFSFRVKSHTARKNRIARTMATAGATNQLSTIQPSFTQLMLVGPTEARPAPTRAPTTVWVPEIGIPKKEDDMMNRKDAREAANMV
jgi:hypothetical protein